MRLLSLILLAFFALAMQSAKPTRIIFFGDSITQAGVNPNGYITRLKDRLAKENKSGDYELIGAGIGGNKVYDLYLRVEDDVIAKKPDVTVIYIGVNDVWHKASSGTGTDPDKFVKFYDALIRKIQGAGSKIVLVTPAAIGERHDNSNQQDGDLNQYSKFIRDLATKYNLPLVDLRKTFMEYNQKNNAQNAEKGILTTDRVHLNEAGNQMVADEMYKFLIK